MQAAHIAHQATESDRIRTSESSTAPARPARALLLFPVGIGALLAVAFGWTTRDEYYVVPHEGLGYALGFIGLAMMLLLLLYSLRKRWSFLRNAGPIQPWFHIHMALGILGPTAILFHSNFRLGSLNANVALACMLTVSLSGVIGRFIYTHVHYEFMGHVATSDEVLAEAGKQGRALSAAVRAVPELGGILTEFRAHCLAPGGVAAQAWRFLTLGHTSRTTHRRARRVYRRAASASLPGAPPPREARRAIREYVRALRRAGQFAAYERAFALWHALHLPFCVGLFLAAAVHVVAVNMY